MGKKIILMVLLAVAISNLPTGAKGNKGTSSQIAIRALRHAGHVSKRQSFGTCSSSQVASMLSGYPSICQSRLRRLDISALENGNTDTLEDIYNFFCEPRCGQPLVNTFCACGMEQVAELIVQACSFNAQGQRCTLRQEIEPLTTALTAAENICLPYSQGSSCSQACKTALVASRDLGGCCVNLFNITRSNLIAIDDYALWASCGVQTPGFCERSSLSPSGNCVGVAYGSGPSVRATSALLAILMAITVWLQY